MKSKTANFNNVLHYRGKLLNTHSFKLLFIFLAILTISACNPVNHLPKTMGDPQNAESYGYQPIDPLPVSIFVDTNENMVPVRISNNFKVSNRQMMASLPDETMRLAIGQIDNKGNLSFATSKLGYAGSNYIVILDYIKFDTKSLPVLLTKDTSNQIIDYKAFFKYDTKPDAVIPVYVGVGLRFTATISVRKGTVDLGNLFAIGLAAESNKVTGTLVIQTLGISGKDISSLIPMPSQINTTTIQNAIMALASIKSKIYEDDAELNPRVVGFYNNLGGGQNTVQKFITNVLTQEMKHIIR